MLNELLINAGVPEALLVLDHVVVVYPLLHLSPPHFLDFLLHREDRAGRIFLVEVRPARPQPPTGREQKIKSLFRRRKIKP
jgi:hypothetical protein